MVNVSIGDHKAWLAQAVEDFWIISMCIKHKRGLKLGAYHAQQAVEKALKAFLVYHTKTVKKVHDLIFLNKKCIEIDFAFIQLEQIASTLTGYATYTRYPDDAFSIDLDEVKQAYNSAQFTIKFVKQRLGISATKNRFAV